MKRFVAICVALALVLVGAVSLVQAQSTSWWRAEYFNNQFLSGSPSAVTNIPSLNVNWGTGAPAQGMSNTFWSARFTTTSWFQAGNYVFSINADDGFTLRVNNVIYADTFNNPQPGKTISVVVPIFFTGNNFVQIDFVQLTGVAFIFTNWQLQKPGGGWQPVPPPATPTPVPPGTVVPSATSVTTQFGNFTPCIQQGIHQVNCFTSTGAWNAPDSGSIAMEPQIMIWGNCTPDSVLVQQVFVGQPAVSTSCSKTGAGWYITPS